MLTVARNEIGYHETPLGSNKTGRYGVYYGKQVNDGIVWDGQDWCGMFATYCFGTAGYPLPMMQHEGYEGFASVAIGMASARQFGWLLTGDRMDPQPGDLALYDWNSDGKPDHVGIVESGIVGIAVASIEGNTGEQSAYVLRQVRKWKSLIGLIRPVFDE